MKHVVLCVIVNTYFIYSATSLSLLNNHLHLPCIYFSQSQWWLRLHGDRLCNRSVGGEGVCVIQGEIHLPAEPGHISEPRAPGASADPEPHRLLSQCLEEQRQPAPLLQGYHDYGCTR